MDAVTVPALLTALRQAIEHLGQARAAVRTAVEEIGRAQTAIRAALGTAIADKTIYAAAAQTRQLLGEADQRLDRTTEAAKDWIRRVEGGPDQGKA